MLKIIDANIKQFRKNITNKNIIIWGCGRGLSTFKSIIHQKNLDLNVIAIGDNNPEIWNKTYIFDEKEYKIINRNQLLNLVSKNKNIILLISSLHYLGDIIKQFDEYEELDGIETYSTYYLNMFNTEKDFVFPTNKFIIPKKIHYFWVGGNPIPYHLQKCIDTWKKYCPDYDIICWNEKNYDFAKNKYTREAYENKKWGFVPDYPRLDIIYKYGGIYLDTDVGLLKSLNPLLTTDAFFFYNGSGVSTGMGFGSIAKNPLIKLLRDDYNNIQFVLDNGNINLKTSGYYQTKALKNYGIIMDNEFKIVNNCAFYPSNVILPLYNAFTKKHITRQTLGFHHCESSWMSIERKEAMNTSSSYITEDRINYLNI